MEKADLENRILAASSKISDITVGANSLQARLVQLEEDYYRELSAIRNSMEVSSIKTADERKDAAMTALRIKKPELWDEYRNSRAEYAILERNLETEKVIASNLRCIANLTR